MNNGVESIIEDKIAFLNHLDSVWGKEFGTWKDTPPLQLRELGNLCYRMATEREEAAKAEEKTKEIRYHLVGFAGFAGSGKDTAAEFLIEKHGFHKESFAKPMKAMALALNPWIFKPVWGFNTLNTLIAEGGWEHAKEFPEVRRFLQCLGTEAGRDLLGEDVWINSLASRMDKIDRLGGTSFVITDVRFSNEAKFIQDQGGVVIWVDRPFVEAPNDHPSASGECRELANLGVMNDGTKEDLWREVLGCLV